ncbi:MAG: DUF6493 family protein [Planctomycetaceae bacterium]
MSLSKQIRTPEGFIERMHNMAPKVFAKAVADLTDGDRRKLSKSVQDHIKSLRRKEREATTLTGVSQAEMLRRIQSRFEGTNVELVSAHLGLLAVAPKSANIVPLPGIRAVSQRWSATKPTEHEEAAITILLDRRPDWAQEWLERQMEADNFGWSLMWPSVRRLLDDGLCTAPDTQGFARFILMTLVRSSLEKEPELAEYVWLQFRHSSGFFFSNGKLRQMTDAWDIQRSASGAEWLWHNVHHGRIDRSRVIDETLAAFWRDFNNSERSTLGKLLEALHLTDDEFVARQSEFRRLLSHEGPAVVTFALKCFKAKKKADGLDADALIADLQPVFSISQKTQPASALVLLKSITGNDVRRKKAAADVAARALQHSEIDVQEAAVNLLESWANVYVPADILQQAVEVLPTVKPRVNALLATAGVQIKQDGEADDLPPTNETAADLFRQIESCPPDIRDLLRLDEALTAATLGRMLPPADVNRLPVDLTTLARVEPVQSVEELIDEVDAVIGNLQSPMQVERVLDGISRFGATYPNGFDARVAPILARFESPDGSIPPFHAALYFPSRYGLVFDWLRKKLHAPPSRLPGFVRSVHFNTPDIAASLELRATELRRSFLQTHTALPLLSLPTHEHGWIDPNEFLSRLQRLIDAEQDISPADFRVGLLRLPPNSTFSGEAVAGLPDNFRRLLTYVEFGNADIQSGDDPSFWLAAGRSRNPRGELTELSALKIPNTAWGLAQAEIKVWLEHSPPAIEYRSWQRQKEREKEQKAGGSTSMGDRLWQVGADIISMIRSEQVNVQDNPLVSIEPRSNGTESEFLPVVMASRSGAFRRWFEEQLPDWAEEWQATHWPANTDGGLALATVFMLVRMDDNASGWVPAAPALRPLLWSERAWSPTALTALWLGLFAKDADVRAVAGDALIEGILDGRAHPDELSPVLLEMLREPWLKLNRLAEALSEVARVSQWSAMVVSHILDTVIAARDELPRDAHHLLTVQLNALIQVDSRLSPAARRPLESVKGGSKTAKLAKQLLALNPPVDSEKRRAALLQGVECRVRRVAH